MVASSGKFLAAGTRVRISEPGPVPTWSTWDDDNQRTSNHVKRRLQTLFFKGDRRVSAEVLYIGNESVRDKLRADGRVKVQLRDPAGSIIIVTAPTANLKKA